MAKGLDGKGVTYLWKKFKTYVDTAISNISGGSVTTDGAFTKTKSRVIRNITYSEPVELDIGFKPKTFELIGIGDGSGIYLQWDKTNGWTGNEGPLYDYDVDLSNNTVTINTHMTMECDFIWRAFG